MRTKGGLRRDASPLIRFPPGPLDGHDALGFVYVYSDVVHFLFFFFTSLAVDWTRSAEDSHSSARRYFAIRMP